MINALNSDTFSKEEQVILSGNDFDDGFSVEFFDDELTKTPITVDIDLQSEFSGAVSGKIKTPHSVTNDPG